MYSIIDNS